MRLSLSVAGFRSVLLLALLVLTQIVPHQVWACNMTGDMTAAVVAVPQPALPMREAAAIDHRCCHEFAVGSSEELLCCVVVDDHYATAAAVHALPDVSAPVFVGVLPAWAFAAIAPSAAVNLLAGNVSPPPEQQLPHPAAVLRRSGHLRI